jgi:hypothetical protein
MDGDGQDKAGGAAVRERIASYVDSQLARLLERVTAAVSQYQQGVVDARDVNRIIEHYYEAEQALSRWADSGLVADHLEFLDGQGTDTFDWWGAPELETSNQLNAVVADRESREREARRVRWPWSKVQRRDSY